MLGVSPDYITTARTTDNSDKKKATRGIINSVTDADDGKKFSFHSSSYASPCSLLPRLLLFIVSCSELSKILFLF